MNHSDDKTDSKGNHLVSVWTTNLNLLTFPALLRICLRHRRFNLRFIAATRSGIALAQFLKTVGFLASNPQRVEFTRDGERVDEPGSERLRIQALSGKFTDDFLINYHGLLEELVYPDQRIRAEQVLTNIRKIAATTTYELLAFLEHARYQHRAEGTSPRRLVIVSPAAVLANTVPPGWAGPDTEFISPWNKHHSLSLRLGRAIIQGIKGITRSRQARPEAPASIGVEMASGLDRSAVLNDLFWWWDSGIAADRVVLYFDRRDYPASHEVVAHAERLGIRCAVVDRQAVGDSPHLLSRRSAGLSVSARRFWRSWQGLSWGIYRGPVGRWLACRILDMLYQSEQIEDFLVEYNIRALFNYQEGGPDYWSLACEATDAARVGYHWSHYPWPAAYQSRLHQVYFAWGIQHENILKSTNSCIGHLLLSGCIVEGTRPGDSDETVVQQYRTSVTANGATRVLAIFDTSLPCEKFYEFFFNRAVQDHRWGLLVKPKSFDNLPWVSRRLPELQDLYEEALATGRVKMLNWQITPTIAAAAADFAVGVDINSATVIAALAGHRAIHLDYVRLHDSLLSKWAKFYHAGPNRLVFDDPDRLWERLNSYFDEPGSDPGLGLVDDTLLREIDPFHDSFAGQRIGEYLRWYLEGLDQGLGRDLSLIEATRRYSDKWGVDKVVRGLPLP